MRTVKRVRVVLRERREVAALRARVRAPSQATRALASGARRTGGGEGWSAERSRGAVCSVRGRAARRGTRLDRGDVFLPSEAQAYTVDVLRVAAAADSLRGRPEEPRRSGARHRQARARRAAGERTRTRAQGERMCVLEHVQEGELRVVHARGPVAHWPQHPLHSVGGGGARVRRARAAGMVARHLRSYTTPRRHEPAVPTRRSPDACGGQRPSAQLETGPPRRVPRARARFPRFSLALLLLPFRAPILVLLLDYHQTSRSGRWTTTTPSEIAAARSMM